MEEISVETRVFDVNEKLGGLSLHVNAQLFRMPYYLRNRWEKYFLNKANAILLDELKRYNPDLVLVYNSEYLLPDTCLEIRKKASLVFYMADSPFYTLVNDYYLSCLSHASLILSPDSFWMKQMNILGLRNTAFFIPGIDSDSYFRVEESKELTETETSDILYAGTSYANSWGYKKALLMSKFTGYNFKLYGNRMWKRWFRFFPQLETHFTETGYIPTYKLNLMFNKTRLMPVDGNPAILNGFHLRLFEAIGSGALPLAEFREDIEGMVFRNSDVRVPIINDYNDASDIAGYYLKNETESKEMAEALRRFVLYTYDKSRNAERLLDYLIK